MIKELFFAIILGALLGFGATGSILTLRQNKNQPPADPNPTPVVTPATTPQTTSPAPTITDSQLTIVSPTADSLVSTAKTEIKGITQSGNIIIIRTPVKTFQTIADNNGNFIIDIELESGINPVLITSINPTDNSQTSTQIFITFSTAKI